MKFKRVIGNIGDMHTGSTVALWPEDFFWEGRHIPTGEVQKVLCEYWDDAVEKLSCCDSIFFLSDNCEGLAKKEAGKNLMISDLSAQTAANIHLIKPLCKKKKTFFWSGSLYHESFDYQIHKAIAEAVGGQFMGVVSNLKIKGTNVRCHVKHAGPGGMQYRASGMDKENMNSLLAHASGKIERPDLILEGHHHFYNMLDTGNGIVVKNPCWKAWEPSNFWAKNYHRMQPDIGYTITRIDMDDNITIEKKLYPVPHIADDWISA